MAIPMTAGKEINPKNYYRMPWSLTDNGISWLEVTTKCNLACKGCYRDPALGGHKTLDEIAEELATFKKLRKSDCMSIAGGDPLVHPRIVEIVRMIREGGWKPILNTNGVALTPELLQDLKKAGVFGFTFHIDTSQKRPDFDGTTEADLNELRERFARQLAAVGGLACSFNQTVKAETLNDIPEVVRWAAKHPDIVHTLVFILYRQPYMLGGYDFYAHGKKIQLDTYADDTWGGEQMLKAKDIIAKIREVMPDCEPAGYLGGSVDPDSMKWTLCLRAAIGEQTFGFLSPKFMETVQSASHWFRKKYLSYAHPKFLGTAKATTMAFAPFDRKMRRVFMNFLSHALIRPSLFFRKMRVQTFTIIQPVDVLQDGSMNMCDGCPDMTVHNGKLYWSCRLEEIKKYGAWVQTVPKDLNVLKSQMAPVFHNTLPNQDTTKATPV